MKILQDGEQGVRIDSNFNSNSNSILTPWWRVTFYITGSVWWNHWRPPKGDNDNKICGPWRDFVSTWPHMYTMVASYQEPSEIPEEILINKLNTEVGLKTKYSYKYYQSTADCWNPYNSQKLHTVSQMRHSFIQLCSWVFEVIKGIKGIQYFLSNERKHMPPFVVLKHIRLINLIKHKAMNKEQ